MGSITRNLTTRAGYPGNIKAPYPVSPLTEDPLHYTEVHDVGLICQKLKNSVMSI